MKFLSVVTPPYIYQVYLITLNLVAQLWIISFNDFIQLYLFVLDFTPTLKILKGYCWSD